MAWNTAVSGSQLTLTGTYVTVKDSGGVNDLVITLSPGETADVSLKFTPQTTPTENCDVVIIKSGDGVEFESPGEAQREIIEYSNREADAVPIRLVQVYGVQKFKIMARVRNTDDTAGGTDTASKLDVTVTTDGINI